MVHLNKGKPAWWRGLRPGPRLGSLQRSRRPRSWWGGDWLPLPKTPTAAFNPSGLSSTALRAAAEAWRAVLTPLNKILRTPMQSLVHWAEINSKTYGTKYFREFYKFNSDVYCIHKATCYLQLGIFNGVHVQTTTK